MSEWSATHWAPTGTHWAIITWAVLVMIFGASLFAFGMMSGGDRWDKAVVIKICRDGTPILRLPDESVWARRGLRAYRVEDWQTVCER